MYIKDMDIGGIAGGSGPQRPGAGPLVIGKGEVVRALVVEVLPDDKAVLEIAGRTITAKTALPLAGMKGKTVLLQSLGAEGKNGNAPAEVVLKLLGQAGQENTKTAGQVQELTGRLQALLEPGFSAAEKTGALLGKLENLLPEALRAEGQLGAEDKQAVAGLLVRLMGSGDAGFSQKLSDLLSVLGEEKFKNSLAGEAEVPGADGGLPGQQGQGLLAAIRALFPEAGGLTAAALEKALRDSGILFEAKLLASGEGPDGLPNGGTKGKNLIGGDLKALLLKLKSAFGQEGQAGLSEKTPQLADGLLRDLRAFQFLSKLTGSLYGFLPARWEGLKDGRLAFKPDGQDGGSCLINLDLEGLGKINVSVFMRGGEFYVTLRIQDASFREAVGAEARDKKTLTDAFRGKGLSLRSVNVTDFEDSLKNHLEFPGGGHIINIRL